MQYTGPINNGFWQLMIEITSTTDNVITKLVWIFIPQGIFIAIDHYIIGKLEAINKVQWILFYFFKKLINIDRLFRETGCHSEWSLVRSLPLLTWWFLSYFLFTILLCFFFFLSFLVDSTGFPSIYLLWLPCHIYIVVKIDMAISRTYLELLFTDNLNLLGRTRT